MSIQPKVYVAGQERKVDELAKLYDELNTSTFTEREDSHEERSEKDPFGHQIAPEFSNNYERAKAASERFTKFFALLVQEFGLAPKAAMFMAELSFLNIFNAEDIPATPEDINEARELAYQYFTKARELLAKHPLPKR